MGKSDYVQRKEPRPGHRDPKRELGPFEAVSRKLNGDLIRTHHHTREMAERRLQGVRRHDDHKIIDHNQKPT